MQIAVIGLDLAKNVFQVHDINDSGQAVLKRKLRRSEVLPFFAGLAPALVGIEACHTAHYWGREIAAFGHDVRLMPPQFVKPYVKSQKNDAADAEAPKPCKDSRCGLCQSNLRIAASDARLTNSPAEQPYQRHSRPFVNAGEILRRLAGVKVQHGRKQEGPPIWGAFLLFAFHY
jgi:hypothetical protein